MNQPTQATGLLKTFRAGQAQVEIYPSKAEQGEAAAVRGSQLVREAIGRNGWARIIMRSEYLICCVPEARKAEAVHKALEKDITTDCLGSLLRTHPRATIYLDRDSAAQLSDFAAC